MRWGDVGNFNGEKFLSFWVIVVALWLHLKVKVMGSPAKFQELQLLLRLCTCRKALITVKLKIICKSYLIVINVRFFPKELNSPAGS